MSNQWKMPINSNEIWYEKVVRKIYPPEPIVSGRRTGITESFNFDETVSYFLYILDTLS